MERADVDAVVALLAEDATFSMPPLASWSGGRAGSRSSWPGGRSPARRWRTVPARVNGQPALAFYAWDEQAKSHLPFALNVLTVTGDRISDVVAFVARSTEPREREAYWRWVDQPADAHRLESTFGRFGLPERLD